MNGTNSVTQPDKLLDHAFSCLVDNLTPDAARLAILASAYLSFDRQRLQSAPHERHMEVGVRWFMALMNDEQRMQLDTSEKALKADVNAWQTFCSELNSLGPPAYYPSYIYRIRLKAPDAGVHDPRLKTSFYPMRTWRHILTDELSCRAWLTESPT